MHTNLWLRHFRPLAIYNASRLRPGLFTNCSFKAPAPKGPAIEWCKAFSQYSYKYGYDIDKRPSTQRRTLWVFVCIPLSREMPTSKHNFEFFPSAFHNATVTSWKMYVPFVKGGAAPDLMDSDVLFWRRYGILENIARSWCGLSSFYLVDVGTISIRAENTMARSVYSAPFNYGSEIASFLPPRGRSVITVNKKSKSGESETRHMWWHHGNGAVAKVLAFLKRRRCWAFGRVCDTVERPPLTAHHGFFLLI